jgi:hypothetical protein
MLRALLEAEGTAAFAVYAVSQLGVAKQVGCVLAATPPRRLLILLACWR